MKLHQSKLWQYCGRLVFWVTWPGIWFMIQFSPPRSRVVVLHGHSVLLVRDWLGNGQWKLPGGGLKKHEDPAQGAQREVAEETGIDLKTSALQPLETFNITSHGFKLRIVSFVAVLSQRPTVTLQKNELTHYMWANFDDCQSLNLSKTTRRVLQALQQRGSTRS